MLDKVTSPLANSLNAFKNSCSKSTKDEIKDLIDDTFDEVVTSLAVAKLRIKKNSDLFSLHGNVMKISKKITAIPSCDEVETIRALWLESLKKMNGKIIERQSATPVSFDCSPAISIVESRRVPKIHFVELNRQCQPALEGAVNTMEEMEEESLGGCFHKGFLRHLIDQPESRCLMLNNDQEKTIGMAFGFNLKMQNKKIFHVFAMARKANIPKQGVAHLLSEEGLQKLQADKTLDFISLNVMSDNQAAIQLYEKLGFVKAVDNFKVKQLLFKVCMYKKIDQTTSNDPLQAKEVNAAMTAFIIRSNGLFKLLFYEIARQMTLLKNKVFYSQRCFEIRLSSSSFIDEKISRITAIFCGSNRRHSDKEKQN